MAKKGMDVSAFQGIIDWNKVKANGIEYAILRAGWGQGTIDKQFNRNLAECERIGMPKGIYWFSYAINPEYAKKEALCAIKAVQNHKLEYPIWFDYEYDSTAYAAKKGVVVTKDLASAMAKAFMDTVKAAGLQTGNYSNLDYCKRYFNDDINKNYDLWYAYWGSATNATKAAAMWQYSSSGNVAGIAGRVDMDISNKSYPAGVAPSPDVPITPAKDYYNIPAVYSLVFDPEWYLVTYKDLQAAVQAQIASGAIKNEPGAIAWWLYQHFYTFGMDEADNGRFGNSVFNVKKYKAAMTDLQQAFGNASYKPYYQHYMLTGAKEIATGKRKNFM